MNWLLFALLLLAPLVLLVAVAVGWPPFLRKRCPQCEHNALVPRGGMLATITIDGDRDRDCWWYFRCESCEVGLKLRRQEWSVVEEEKWAERARPE